MTPVLGRLGQCDIQHHAMTANVKLIELFRQAEDKKLPVRVSFADGSRFDLLVRSTTHAEAGGDIVADVLRSIGSPAPALWKTAAMNFKLEDVVRVETTDECFFAR
jgi:hypothetical protein